MPKSGTAQLHQDAPVFLAFTPPGRAEAPRAQSTASDYAMCKAWLAVLRRLATSDFGEEEQSTNRPNRGRKASLRETA